MAELDIAEKRIPQDGRFRLKIKGRRIDFRVSVMPSIHGEDAVIRILDKESISERFSELRLDILGMADEEVRRIRRFIHEPYGMFLVTGPTGSGKTTTLYAAWIYEKTNRHHGSVEYQLESPDPGQREERPHLRPGTPIDPSPRPRQDHGGRNPRR
jgi:type IV pilus assembly protein PilB